MKPKNAVATIAQRTALSRMADVASNCYNAPSMRIAIGRRIRGSDPLSTLALPMPTCTLLRVGRADWSLGSGGPREICMLLSTDG